MSGVEADTVVVGIGNPLRRDDGVGPAVVALLEPERPLGVDLCVLDGEAARLVDALRGRRRAIVVDACVSDAPGGTITRLDIAAGEQLDGQRPLSSHGGGLVEAVGLCRALGVLPAEMVVYAVEAQDLTNGEGLSAPVQKAMPTLLEKLRAELEAPRFRGSDPEASVIRWWGRR